METKLVLHFCYGTHAFMQMQVKAFVNRINRAVGRGCNFSARRIGSIGNFKFCE